MRLVRTWMKQLGQPNAGLPPAPVRLLPRLIAAGLALSLLTLAIQANGQPADASYYSAESEKVELSVAEADSLLDLIDDQRLEIDLLRADLYESRALAASDSTLAADRIDLLRDSYEHMLDAYKADRDNWVERITKSPLVWFGLGVWLAGQAK